MEIAEENDEGLNNGLEGGALRGPPGMQVVGRGKKGTLEHGLEFLNEQNKCMSPWHGVPLYNFDLSFNFLCTTPRGSSLEYGVSKEDAILKPKVRGKQPACFAYSCPWNYGMLPQTWADPEQANLDYGGFHFDGQPVEVVEIGRTSRELGEIYGVKPLGAFALIDPSEGQLCWKIVAVDVADPVSEVLHDAKDVHQRMPGTLEEVREWLRVCHRFGPVGQDYVFGRNERVAQQAETMVVVAQANASWQLLVAELPKSITAEIRSPRSPLDGSHSPSFSADSDNVEARKGDMDSIQEQEGDDGCNETVVPEWIKQKAKAGRLAYMEPVLPGSRRKSLELDGQHSPWNAQNSPRSSPPSSEMRLKSASPSNKTKWDHHRGQVSPLPSPRTTLSTKKSPERSPEQGVSSSQSRSPPEKAALRTVMQPPEPTPGVRERASRGPGSGPLKPREMSAPAEASGRAHMPASGPLLPSTNFEKAEDAQARAASRKARLSRSAAQRAPSSNPDPPIRGNSPEGTDGRSRRRQSSADFAMESSGAASAGAQANGSDRSSGRARSASPEPQKIEDLYSRSRSFPRHVAAEAHSPDPYQNLYRELSMEALACKPIQDTVDREGGHVQGVANTAALRNGQHEKNGEYEDVDFGHLAVAAEVADVDEFSLHLDIPMAQPVDFSWPEVSADGREGRGVGGWDSWDTSEPPPPLLPRLVSILKVSSSISVSGASSSPRALGKSRKKVTWGWVETQTIPGRGEEREMENEGRKASPRESGSGSSATKKSQNGASGGKHGKQEAARLSPRHSPTSSATAFIKVQSSMRPTHQSKPAGSPRRNSEIPVAAIQPGSPNSLEDKREQLDRIAVALEMLDSASLKERLRPTQQVGV